MDVEPHIFSVNNTLAHYTRFKTNPTGIQGSEVDYSIEKFGILYIQREKY